MTTEQTTQTRAQRFVNSIIANIDKDKGMGAKLRQADNPATEYQAWEYLVRYGNVDLNVEEERKAFCTVGAALSRVKPKKDGTAGLGKALAKCYETKGNKKTDAKNDKNSQANAKLHRLLACKSTVEACKILRTLLSLIASKAPEALCYARLLNDLRYFDDQTRMRWAQDFFNHEATNQDTETTEEQL